MSASTIEWTERTWNPVVGCSVISAGCTNCYAMTLAGRLEAMFRAGQDAMAHYAGTTQPSKAGAVWTGTVNVAPDAIFLAPLKRKKPTTWFVNSMSDLFHDSVPDDVIDRVFAVMALCPQHRFQVLTKRSARMRAYLANPATPKRVAAALLDIDLELNLPGARVLAALGNRAAESDAEFVPFPLQNVWLGVSVEDRRAADARIPDLLATPAVVRFLSCEPLLGPVDLKKIRNAAEPGGPLNGLTGYQALTPAGGQGVGYYFAEDDEPRPRIDWVIVGGESGPGARPMHPDWARGLRDQCAAAGVPFFFKQWGAWAPDHGPEKVDGQRIVADKVMEGRVSCAVLVNGEWRHFADGYAVPIELCGGHQEVYRYGKKAAGRLLDGVKHDGLPA